MRIRFLPVIFVLSAIAAHAQADADLSSHLKRLGQQADELAHLMPGFTCNESVVSDELHSGKLKKRVELTAALRTRRAADGSLAETHIVLTVGGKPTDKQSVGLPLYVAGGFDKAMSYFSPARQACYEYSLAPGRIDFETVTSPPPGLPCNAGLRGFARLDTDGNVTYLERHVPPMHDPGRTVVTFAAVDFAPVELKGHTYRLSRRLVADEPRDKVAVHFEAVYSACKLFTAQVTLGAVNSTDPTEDSPPPTPH